MTGTFIDTIIICTLTGLAILVTGQWTSALEGAPLTQSAFASIFGHMGTYALTLSLVLLLLRLFSAGVIMVSAALSFYLARHTSAIFA